MEFLILVRQIFFNMQDYEKQYAYMQKQETVYGNYLAGRIAHIRQDYDNAAYYYVKSLEKGMVNKDLLGKTYIILASQGQIDKAVKYAQIARKNGDDNTFIDVIDAVNNFKHGKYKEARDKMVKIEEKREKTENYPAHISPLFAKRFLTFFSLRMLKVFIARPSIGRSLNILNLNCTKQVTYSQNNL